MCCDSSQEQQCTGYEKHGADKRNRAEGLFECVFEHQEHQANKGRWKRAHQDPPHEKALRGWGLRRACKRLDEEPPYNGPHGAKVPAEVDANGQKGPEMKGRIQ
jgi:hypothetical protein